jgi:hypothetical protein
MILVHMFQMLLDNLCQKLRYYKRMGKGMGTCMIWLTSSSLCSNAHAKNCLQLNPETAFIPFLHATNSFPLKGPFVQTTKSCAPVSGKFYCTMDRKHQKQATEKISMFLPSTQSSNHSSLYSTIGDSSSQELRGRA